MHELEQIGKVKLQIGGLTLGDIYGQMDSDLRFVQSLNENRDMIDRENKEFQDLD